MRHIGLTAIVLAWGGVASVHGATLLTETFTYSDGALDQAGTGWSVISGTTDTMTIASGALVISDAGTEDFAKSLSSSVSAWTVFYAFDLIVPSTDESTSGGGAYFAALTDGGLNYTARLFVAAPSPSATDQYRIGVSSNSDTPTFWASNLSADTSYRIVVGFDHTTDDTTLWINPTGIGSTSVIADGSGITTTLSRFAFRVAGTPDGDKTIDNLVVATTFTEAVPEPASLSLLAMAGLVGLRRRRAVR